MAQNENFTMEKNEQKIDVFKSEKEIVINVSAEKLWGIIGTGFADYDEWATIVDHSEGKGVSKYDGAPFQERVCSFDSGQGPNEVKETLLQYSDNDMHLSYEVIQGMPETMDNATNEITVVRISKNKSKIIINMTWGVKGPLDEQMSKMMKENMSGLMNTFFNDIKVYVETGKVSDMKQKRLDELANMK